jgi:transcription elongation GreA/GreB family factor
MKIKEQLFEYCNRYVQERLDRIRGEISSTQRSANAETKSSAGDKHETARAMAQLDVEMNLKQLSEAEKLQTALQGIQQDRVSAKVIPGSLVITSNGTFYIAISIGATTIGNKEYFIVSPDSPIGKQLIGKTSGDSISWNGRTYILSSVN